MAAICQRTQSKLDEVGDKYSIEKRYTSYEDLLADPDIHAVHINSPIPDHGRQWIQALKAGKHVACTVPMATTVEECRQIVELVKQTGLKYMMMETVVYAREFLFMKEMYDNGELGKVKFLNLKRKMELSPKLGK
jgi:predicted dehydrogenase